MRAVLVSRAVRACGEDNQHSRGKVFSESRVHFGELLFLDVGHSQNVIE
jgi:hypothetical protein